MKAIVHTPTILHIYHESAVDMGPMQTADGQLIQTEIKTVKVRCSCGLVSLDEILFVADESEAE